MGAHAPGARPEGRGHRVESAGLGSAYRKSPPKPAAPGRKPGQPDGLRGSSTSEKLHQIVEVLDQVAREVGKTVAQVALNWVLRRPTVSSVIFGARNEQQLLQNLGAVGWTLDEALVARLDAVSETRPAYPYWHQRQFPQLNPPPVPERGTRAT